MKKHNTQKMERALFAMTISLTLFGLLMIASAGAVYSETRFGSQWFFVLRQAIAAGIGFVGLFIVRRIDYHVWQRLAVVSFIVAVGLLLLLFVPGLGVEVYGARRWLAFGPISFQPAELMKITLIFYLAAFFAARSRKHIRDVYEGLMPFLVAIGVVSFLLISQPDVGTLGLILMIAVAIFFVAGARMTHIIALGIAGVMALFALIKAAPYRMERFTTFLHPTLDPHGAGYQVMQALIAVGSGGLFGRGFGHSLQKFNYLPEPVGDSIFAVIAEEWGFIGALGVVCMFIIIGFIGYRIALRAPDAFGRLVAVGITTWIVLQAFFNIAAITALMPLTGIPLPLISYGSTALVITLVAIGVLLNIAQHARR